MRKIVGCMPMWLLTGAWRAAIGGGRCRPRAVLGTFGAVVLGVWLLAGCTTPGMVDDYATMTNAFAETATDNTIKQLSRKHDIELRAYLSAACGQPRAGALMRQFTDEEILDYFAFCRRYRSETPGSR